MLGIDSLLKYYLIQVIFIMSSMSIDLSLSSETLEGEYDYETNKVSLHLNHHYFATDLTREDLENIIEGLKQLQALYI